MELNHALQAAGAAFDPEHPASPPLHFGDPAAEYQAAQTEAAVFDVSDRAQIELTGDDRAKFLHNFCTNDVKRLQPQEGCEAFVTNVKGRVLAHIFIFAAPHSLWIETPGPSRELLLNHLDRYLITEDVQIHDRTPETGELFVSGPRAAERLAAAHIAVSQLPAYGHTKIDTLDHPLFVRCVDLLGLPGYLLAAPRDRLGSLWQSLTAAGLQPAGSQAFEALRIEAGMPQYGIDVSDENLAQEVDRTQQAISFTKGCYLGQEPIARLDALGHVNRELRGLELATGPVPPQGTPVVDGDGKEIGRITSSAHSYRTQQPVALAYLRSKWTAPGTEVRVLTADAPVAATVFWPKAK